MAEQGLKWFENQYRPQPKQTHKPPLQADTKTYTQKFFTHVYKLWDANDMKAYREVFDKAADQKAVIDVEERIFSADHDSWVVFIRWIEFEFTTKEEMKPQGVNLNVSSNHPTTK